MSKLPAMIYGFILLLVVIPKLPLEEFGRYTLVFSSLTFLTLSNKFLILFPMIKYGADPKQFENSVRSGIYLSTVFYLISALITWFFAPNLAQIFRISTQDLHFVSYLLAAILLREIGYCVQQILYKTNRIFILEVIFWIGSGLGMIGLSITDHLTSANNALIVNLLAATLSSLAALIFGFGKCRILKRIDLAFSIKMIRYGYFSICIGFSGFLINGGIDNLLIGLIYTPVHVAIYNTAKKAYQMISALSQAVAMIALPKASELAALKNMRKLRDIYSKSVGWTGLLLTGIVILGIFLADPVFRILFAGKYEGSIFLFRILLIGAPFDGIYVVAGSILYGAGAAKDVAMVAIISLMSWIIVSVAGIYSIGLEGAALGLTISMVVMGLLIHRKAVQQYDTGFAISLKMVTEDIKSLLRMKKR